MDPETIAWLESNARRVVDAQLAEVARVNTRARELVGFVGIILGLLATAASQSGSADGAAGASFRFLGVVSVLALLLSAIRVLRALILRRPQLQDVGLYALEKYLGERTYAIAAADGARMRAVYGLTAAAEANEPLVELAQRDFAAGYALFSVGLVGAGLAIVSLLLA